jgi:DNA-binding CsgD family transcriptional regulator
MFEFIGFTSFISRLIKMKINDSKNLESALINNQNKLKQAEKKLSEKLKKESNTSTIEKSHLVGVLKLVEKAITNDSEWEEFKSKFENLNPKFLENILTKHPDLSKSEVRLLILIKLNYSQKEVANILGIEPNSVKKAKNRVRKKLQITDAIVLNDYVNMF